MTYSKWSLSLIAILVLCITAACGSVSLIGGSPIVNKANAPISFTQFIQDVTNARYSDYAHQTATKAKSEKDFEEMRLSILASYDKKEVTNSYMVNNQVIDCVVVSSPQKAPSASHPSHDVKSPNGQSNSAVCKKGTFPMQRITLEHMVKFPTLQMFMNPDGKRLPRI